MIMNDDLTISDALERAEEQMTLAYLAENTCKAYRLEIRGFFDTVSKLPSEIGAEDVRTWLLGCIESGLPPGSTNMTAAAMRFLFRDALDCPDRGFAMGRLPESCHGTCRRRRSDS